MDWCGRERVSLHLSRRGTAWHSLKCPPTARGHWEATMRPCGQRAAARAPLDPVHDHRDRRVDHHRDVDDAPAVDLRSSRRAHLLQEVGEQAHQAVHFLPTRPVNHGHVTMCKSESRGRSAPSGLPAPGLGIRQSARRINALSAHSLTCKTSLESALSHYPRSLTHSLPVGDRHTLWIKTILANTHREMHCLIL